MTDQSTDRSDSPACVIGLGYVGLPLTVALARTGRRVVGYDSSAARVGDLTAGRSGIEDISDQELAEVSQLVTFTNDIQDCAAATTFVICVPTPLVEGQPDLSAVRAAAGAIGSVISRGDLVVLESTSYPGTTEEVVGGVITERSGLHHELDYLLAFSPERIDPANPQFGVTNTPKVVGGATAEAGERAAGFYGAFVDKVVRVRGTREAEMTKLLENTFRHLNIALVNELTMFCHALDIDIWEVIDAASTKPFGFMPFRPGPGVGGHCIPVDPSYLSWAVRRIGHQFRLVELAQDVNARMPSYVVQRAQSLLNTKGLALSRSRVLCVGVAYKPDVADTRESPALEVLDLLLAGGAAVDYHDPHVPTLAVGGSTMTSTTLDDDGLAACDLVIVLTPHRAIDWAALEGAAGPLVLDTRGLLPQSPNLHRL